MRFIERRARRSGPAATATATRRHRDIFDTRDGTVVATGLRLWDAARRADALSASWSAAAATVAERRAR